MNSIRLLNYNMGIKFNCLFSLAHRFELLLHFIINLGCDFVLGGNAAADLFTLIPAWIYTTFSNYLKLQVVM